MVREFGHCSRLGLNARCKTGKAPHPGSNTLGSIHSVAAAYNVMKSEVMESVDRAIDTKKNIENVKALRGPNALMRISGHEVGRGRGLFVPEHLSTPFVKLSYHGCLFLLLLASPLLRNRRAKEETRKRGRWATHSKKKQPPHPSISPQRSRTAPVW